MKRYFFFVLFFPAAFMNLMLVQASPTNLVKYFLAGYVVAVLPAMLMALICDAATNRSPAFKAGWCAVAAFITSPLMLAWAGLSPWRCLQVSAFGAVAGFLSVMIFEKKAFLLLPSPDYFKKEAKGA
jgi:mannitol-specific phosphotransferase system IIBC component